LRSEIIAGLFKGNFAQVSITGLTLFGSQRLM